jgi:hypothetical protein
MCVFSIGNHVLGILRIRAREAISFSLSMSELVLESFREGGLRGLRGFTALDLDLEVLEASEWKEVFRFGSLRRMSFLHGFM